MSIVFDPTRLPVEIIELILSQLELKDKARLTRLNRAWSHFLNTNSRLWTVLDFGGSKIDIKCLELYCSRANYNVKVFRAWRPPKVLQALRRCRNLEILELGRGGQERFIGLDWADFAAFTSLRTLSLQDYLRTGPARAIIDRCHQLENIQLTIDDPDESPVWTGPLGTKVKNLKLLVDHEVEAIRFQEDFFKDANVLEELMILGPHTLPSMVHLENLSILTLDSCINLKALPASLLRLEISDCDGVMLAGVLPRMTRLESLTLSRIFSMDQAVSLRMMEDVGTKLKHLSLVGIFTDDIDEYENENVMFFSLPLLQSCESVGLQSLKLYTDHYVDLDLMFRVIGSKFSKLKQLEIRAHRRVQPIDLEHLVQRISALEFLALRNFKVEEATLQAIRKRGVLIAIEDR